MKDWAAILSSVGCSNQTATSWAPVFARVITPATFSKGDAELPDFLGQVMHESGMLTRIEENLNYTSAARICAVWPTRFRTQADAEPFVRNPQGLANKVYGGRMGNTQPGDGWKFRGRGLLQVTGRDNYRTVGERLGVDLVTAPDLLARPVWALRSAVAWWNRNIPDEALGNVSRITKLVNGGDHGLADRLALTQRAGSALA